MYYTVKLVTVFQKYWRRLSERSHNFPRARGRPPSLSEHVQIFQIFPKKWRTAFWKTWRWRWPRHPKHSDNMSTSQNVHTSKTWLLLKVVAFLKFPHKNLWVEKNPDFCEQFFNLLELEENKRLVFRSPTNIGHIAALMSCSLCSEALVIRVLLYCNNMMWEFFGHRGDGFQQDHRLVFRLLFNRNTRERQTLNILSFRKYIFSQ